MKSKKRITILGSTGSIGKSTIDVISFLGNYQLEGIAFFSNISEGLKQIHRFGVKKVCVFDDDKRKEIKKLIPASVKLFPAGVEGLCKLVESVDSDILMLAVSGSIGIFPIFCAIGRIPRICVANKEPLVIAGQIIKKEANKNNTLIIPVDSEPSAIFQILGGFDSSPVKKVYLTASGGPFYRYCGDLSYVSPSQAIKHPRWRMGKKISVDSATLMNKGLEVIEIKNLFDIDVSKIEVVIHPQSIIHSALEFCDGSIMAQMSYPDMRLPIQYSITWPERIASPVKKLNIFEAKKLEFYKPDFKKFPCLILAIESARKGDVYPALLNAANEVAVEMFLSGLIKFNEIAQVVARVIKGWNSTKRKAILSIDAIVEADGWARYKAREVAESILKERR
ncbi:MAG: 1-deoxy-D-xylulose-5-phosphate reductoisomerase [Elusimicrobiales bacterium]